MKYLKVFCTAPDAETAEHIANAVVASKNAACASIVPGLTSIYRWKGEICRGAELLLIMKTTRERYPDLEKEILSIHPYEVPEIVALPIETGYDKYLAWIGESTLP
jgi:periplasmic divalent cation tolerance protein